MFHYSMSYKKKLCAVVKTLYCKVGSLVVAFYTSATICTLGIELNTGVCTALHAWQDGNYKTITEQ